MRPKPSVESVQFGAKKLNTNDYCFLAKPLESVEYKFNDLCSSRPKYVHQGYKQNQCQLIQTCRGEHVGRGMENVQCQMTSGSAGSVMVWCSMAG